MSTTIRRRVAGSVFAGILTITLAGCGNSIEDEPDASAPTLPDVQSEVEANASADAQAEEEAAAASSTGPETNARGNIVKELGEEGRLVSEDDGETLYSFAIDSITPDVPCTEEYGSYDPENGHLTAVQMRVSTGAFTPEDFSYLSVGSSDFSFIGSDGLTFTNVDTVATYGCLSESVKFPSGELNPGSQYAGAVLLDLPEASGTLIYQPSSMMGPGGWEISY
ncbi:hypothetical protein [Modestobacter sp. SYSU DS0875]